VNLDQPRRTAVEDARESDWLPSPKMHYDNCGKRIMDAGLTKADLELVQQSLTGLGPVGKALDTIAGGCRMLLKK